MQFKADLHIHSVLSPCGDIDMSPTLIVQRAKECGLKIISITDHNSTLNCSVTKKIAEENDILLICGAEITSKEEIHCLVYVEEDKLVDLQKYLEEHIGNQINNEDLFGYQLVVDRDENVISQEEKLLIQAIDQNIYQIQEKIEELKGLFILAHVDAHRNSISSQLGFIPPDLNYNALEFKQIEAAETTLNHRHFIKDKPIILQSSDAHYLEDIAKRFSYLELEKLDSASFFKYFRKK